MANNISTTKGTKRKATPVKNKNTPSQKKARRGSSKKGKKSQDSISEVEDLALFGECSRESY